jgi:hypothetical protein
LAEAILRTYYPHERPRGSLEPRNVDVDGRSGCRVTHLDFHAETAVFALVDVGEPTRAVLFASLPDVQHVPSPDDVLRQVTVASA